MMMQPVLKGRGTVGVPAGNDLPVGPYWPAVVPPGVRHDLQTPGTPRNELLIDSAPPPNTIPNIVAGSSEDVDLLVACGSQERPVLPHSNSHGVGSSSADREDERHGVACGGVFRHLRVHLVEPHKARGQAGKGHGSRRSADPSKIAQATWSLLRSRLTSCQPGSPASDARSP